MLYFEVSLYYSLPNDFQICKDGVESFVWTGVDIEMASANRPVQGVITGRVDQQGLKHQHSFTIVVPSQAHPW